MRDEKLWVYIDKTIGLEGRKVGNIVISVLKSNEISKNNHITVISIIQLECSMKVKIFFY